MISIERKWKGMARPSLPSSIDSTLPGISRQVLSVSMEPKYQCQKCEEVLRKPFQAQCGHRFCVYCFKQLTRYLRRSWPPSWIFSLPPIHFPTTFPPSAWKKISSSGCDCTCHDLDFSRCYSWLRNGKTGRFVAFVCRWLGCTMDGNGTIWNWPQKQMSGNGIFWDQFKLLFL